MEATLIIRPERWRIITASACWMQTCAPVRLVRSTASQSSDFMRTARASRVMAALFTRISRRPKRSRTCLKPALIWPESATSMGTAKPSPPAPAISATTPASFSAFRAAHATFAPACANASAVARPIPCDAPVTRAMRSFKLNMNETHLRRNLPEGPRESCFRRLRLRLRQFFERALKAFLILDIEAVHGALDLPQDSRQHAPGADLDESGHALVNEQAHGFLPAHRE